MPLEIFRKSLLTDNILDDLRDGLIGEGMMIPSSTGTVPLVYADYVASGRALQQVEDFVQAHVLPYYANTHTEDSFCGRYTGQLREAARAEIARLTGAGVGNSVVFTGSGATSGINRLVALLNVDAAQNPVVFIGPYEHHSNILPWRESNAKVVEIPETENGGPDLAALEQALADHADADLKIGSFSAASNVTGVITDTDPVTRLLKSNGALAVWDYAGGGPYLTIDMKSGSDAEKDAVVISPHKFPGGPGASGVMILRDAAVKRQTPTWPGGGTVAFVSPWEHEYLGDIISREEAGTPNIIGDIRAALAFIVKDVIGQKTIEAREAKLNAMAIKGWTDNPYLTLLGVDLEHRLPIFSFLVHNAAGQSIHYAEVTQKLSDIYGIQSRGGCACAGPYGHRLLAVDKPHSESLHRQMSAGKLDVKPGWIRLNFSYLMDDKTAQYIIGSVDTLTRELASQHRLAG
ncbi:MAG: aminotransferase class V-fold PLP-dependent enzyme [Rhodobacteraceae bacterium]|nr:aminotransferase class V-fold PLP-dependent enzyme [Paracoccaceae bacterium]